MSFNLISSIEDSLSNIVNNYIVRPLGGNSTSGINGFVFDIIADEEISLDSDITDHYVEDNYAIQDHWAQRPLRIRVRGYVGELADLFPNTFLGLLTKVQSLSSIGGYFPTFTQQATEAYAKIAGVAAQAGEVINQANNVYSLLTGASTTATKQQNAYVTLSQMWLSRQLCSVETPYGVFNLMAIESMRALQKDETRLISDFEITFKQINVVSTKVIPNLSVPNLLGAGKALPASPTIVPNTVPNTPTPPGQEQQPQTNTIHSYGNNVSGRVQDMIAPPDNLGNTVGVPPPANITLPTLMPPIFHPALI